MSDNFVLGAVCGAGVMLVVGLASDETQPIRVGFSSNDDANTLRKAGAMPQNVLDRACSQAITQWLGTGSVKPVIIDLSSGRPTLPSPGPKPPTPGNG